MSIELQPVRADDAACLVDWVPDARFLIQWAGPAFRAPLDREQLVAHWERAPAVFPARRCFRAIVPGSDAMVGYGELGDIDLEHRRARLSRLLVGAPNSRGQGLGSALVDALLAVAFVELRLHRVELGVYEDNLRALRCYERAGFRCEGVRRECEQVGGEWWSSRVMGLLGSEWRAARAGRHGTPSSVI